MNKQVSYAYQHLSRTETLGKCIHGSMYLCPALLIALGKFEYYGSGGCQIGDSIDSHNRPFSHIASVIECFNHKISIESNRIIGNFGDNSDITELDIKNFSYSSEDLSGPLVGGATKTALLLSVNKQKFIIKNPYLKTDVYDMIDFLRLIGKKIDISDNSIVCYRVNKQVQYYKKCLKNSSHGVEKLSFRLGLLLIFFCILLMYESVTVDMSVPLLIYCLMSLLVFSTAPFCHDAYESVK